MSFDMRLVTVITLGLMLAASGCTSVRDRVSTADDDAVSASVAPDLAGTWRGTAFAVPGSSHLTSTAVELDITPGGTWAWRAGGATKATGTVVRHGDQVMLQAGPAKGVLGSVGESIPLQQRGDHLWGVSRYFIPGAQSAVDLRRQGPTSGRREPPS
jgi:hypothetical protein